MAACPRQTITEERGLKEAFDRVKLKINGKKINITPILLLLHFLTIPFSLGNLAKTKVTFIQRIV